MSFSENISVYNSCDYILSVIWLIYENSLKSTWITFYMYTTFPAYIVRNTLFGNIEASNASEEETVV